MDISAKAIKRFLDEVGRPNQFPLTLHRFRGRYGVGGKQEAYYNEVVIPHKVMVYKLGLGLAKLADKYHEYKDKRLIDHDLSKLSKQEETYATMDFNDFDNNSSKEIMDFSLAWHHHKHENSHHPEHWFSVNKSGMVSVLPMPNDALLEMVANWMAHGEGYIAENLSGFVFHKQTARKLQVLLEDFGIVTRASKSDIVNGKILK